MFLLLSFAFFALFVRELISHRKDDTFGKQYMGVCFALGLLCAWPAYNHWQFQQKLTDVTHELADYKHADVGCQSAVASIFDSSHIATIGYAYPDTGEVVIKTYWCKRLKAYLKNPEEADQQERYSVMLLVHEAMHIRGELNESKTECQAIQRHIRAAIMLGVDREIAIAHAKRYYLEEFVRHPYYSKKCLPGSQWDEKLPDSVWEV